MHLAGFPTLPLGANFIGFLGLLRSSRYGGVSIAPDASRKRARGHLPAGN